MDSVKCYMDSCSCLSRAVDATGTCNVIFKTFTFFQFLVVVVVCLFLFVSGSFCIKFYKNVKCSVNSRGRRKGTDTADDKLLSASPALE